MIFSLNPSCAKAARGLERLEKLMRGVDPDEDEVSVAGDGEGVADTSTSRVREKIGTKEGETKGDKYV